jgi:altronate hydrolase
VKALLVISDRDNVATALEPLAAGRELRVGNVSIRLREEIPRGHKVALRTIAAGEPIVKYGSPIGIATADVAAGAHVHTHNVASSRGRGDLRQEDVAGEGRLAEPPDDHTSLPDIGHAANRRKS